MACKNIDRKLTAVSQTPCHAARLEDDSRSAHQALRERDHHLAQIRHLSAEVDDLTAEKAAGEGGRLFASREAAARISQAHAAQLEAQHTTDGAQQRIRSQEDELRELESSNKRLAEQAHRWREQLTQQASQLSGERTAHEDEVHALEGAIQTAEKAMQDKVALEQREAEAVRRQMEAQLMSTLSEMEHLRSEVRPTPVVQCLAGVQVQLMRLLKTAKHSRRQAQLLSSRSWARAGQKLQTTILCTLLNLHDELDAVCELTGSRF
jgi:DNA repair exonuclease SbcCD ATPase subunit